MVDDGYFSIVEVDCFVYFLCDFLCRVEFVVFCNYNDVKYFFVFSFQVKKFYEVFQGGICFGDEYIIGVIGNFGVQCNKVRVMFYYFYEKEMVVRVGCILNFVDGLYCSIYRGVVVDSIVGVKQVVVDGVGDINNWNIVFF